MERLPIDEVLPALTRALETGTCAVLGAPPGAGKTTRVPLALLDAPWRQGRILMLEPRRLAARAAAERLADQLGERPGGQVGYRMRGESRPGSKIEVVTEGVLTRMLQSEPDLPGIACVIFDEIHERSLNTDLGLALCLEVQRALREDLRLLAMSATLDTAAVSSLMDGAAVIESAGRMFPVDTRWLDRPWRDGRRTVRLEAAVCDLIRQACEQTAETPGGDLLVFLPGAGEINRVKAALGDLPATLRPLYGAMPFAEQRQALAPDPDGRRKIVLATSIAETSLTVEGVRVVVDAGRARRAAVDPGTGLSRLVTVPVSRAEAEQRRGRAGRVAPGVCYRMWTRAEEGALPAFAPPEITEADLAPLALELAVWGAQDPAELPFLTPPPESRFQAARALLTQLGALEAGGVTAHGREMAAHPLHPRLAHMMVTAAAPEKATAALLAALLTERDPMPRGGADLATRVTALTARRLPEGVDRGAADTVRRTATRLHKGAADPALAPGLLSLAYPDRIALRRPGDQPRYLLSGGRGAVMDAGEPLAGQRLLIAADLEDGREARIRRAAVLSEAELRARHAHLIHWIESAEWSPRTRRVEARRREMLGSIALDDQIWKDVPGDALAAALTDGVRDLGLDALGWTDGARQLRNRVGWLRNRNGALADRLPDWSDAALLDDLETWLTPYLIGCRRIDEIPKETPGEALRATLEPGLIAEIDRAAPPWFETPLGERRRISYDREIPVLSLRVQELFGTDTQPAAGDPPVPLLIELLSPAGRPVQTTRDLPGFWRSSYADVRKEMRARYPKHPWPEDPLAAAPTKRAKPRAMQTKK